jgi:hypothetical protein
MVLWLRKHGEAVQHLSVTVSAPNWHGTKPLVELPFAALKRLQSLTIQGSQLQETACSYSGHWRYHKQQQENQRLAYMHSICDGLTDSSIASLTSLTSLTALELDDVTYGLQRRVEGLSALTRLRELRLGSMRLLQPPKPAQQQQWGDWSSESSKSNEYVLQSEIYTYRELQKHHGEILEMGVRGYLLRLKQLTHLSLSMSLLPSDGMPGPFSRLQQLQELHLHGSVSSPDRLVGLPQSLTMLEFFWACEQQLSSSTVPALAQITAMQHLKIEGYGEGSGGVQPKICAAMQQLSALTLWQVYEAAAVQQLLEVIPTLCKLRSLSINSGEGEAAALPARSFARYSALLPPSTQQLTCLELSWSRGALLPPGSVQHEFAAGRQLPQLKQLLLGLPDDKWTYHDDCMVSNMFNPLQPCVGSDDVRRVASCCPALQQLWLAGVLRPGTDLSPLLQLQQLTCLVTGGAAINDAAAGSVLAKLHGLRRLQLYCCKQLTDKGLLQLAALTGLTTLWAWECGISDELCKDGVFDGVMLQSKVGGELAKQGLAGGCITCTTSAG